MLLTTNERNVEMKLFDGNVIFKIVGQSKYDNTVLRPCRIYLESSLCETTIVTVTFYLHVDDKQELPFRKEV